ncbi:MAG: single-stranded DNA-binding protein [Oscillospiraceae bacterium]|nr:single-stranded DNA-binding protein [Oscillospiraceae bacterium]
MDIYNLTDNRADLVGTLSAPPSFSHKAGGPNSPAAEYWRFPLSITRLSGAEDVLNIITAKETLEGCPAEAGSRVRISGEVRTFNNKSGAGSKLVISVYARVIGLTDEDERNIVQLRGKLCKAPNLRRTPMGREICDIMLAVNRRYERSDYIPCIAWGRIAAQAALWDLGESVAISGRLQSRTYNKVLEDGSSEERTAYEVSVVELE